MCEINQNGHNYRVIGTGHIYETFAIIFADSKFIHFIKYMLFIGTQSIKLNAQRIQTLIANAVWQGHRETGIFQKQHIYGTESVCVH